MVFINVYQYWLLNLNSLRYAEKLSWKISIHMLDNLYTFWLTRQNKCLDRTHVHEHTVKINKKLTNKKNYHLSKTCSDTQKATFLTQKSTFLTDKWSHVFDIFWTCRWNIILKLNNWHAAKFMLFGLHFPTDIWKLTEKHYL